MVLKENAKDSRLFFSSLSKPCYESGLKSIFVAKLCVVLNFCILINNELTPVQKFKTS